MDQTYSVEDIFSGELWEALKTDQSAFIRFFKQVMNKLLVLQSQKEAEAIPDMIYIIEFMEKLLSVDPCFTQQESLTELIQALPEFLNYLVDTFFPDVTTLIFKAGMFPNQNVLGYTARYLELIVMLSMKLFREGHPLMIRNIDQVLSPDKSYYIGNSAAKVDPYFQPFGDRLVDEEEHTKFCQSLQPGDLVDAVKSSQGDTKTIWSRGVVTDVKEYNVYVSFCGENQTGMKERFLKKAPFQIGLPGTRAEDFDWRQALDKGQRADVYMSQKGWLLFEVEERIEQFDQKDTFRFVRLSQVVEEGAPRAAHGEEETGQFGREGITRSDDQRARPDPQEAGELQRTAVRERHLLQRGSLRVERPPHVRGLQVQERELHFPRRRLLLQLQVLLAAAERVRDERGIRNDGESHGTQGM